MSIIALKRWSGHVAGQVKKEFNGLADVWDHRVVRFGDLSAGAARSCAPQPGAKLNTHANTYTPLGGIRMAFRGLGKSGASLSVGQVCVDGGKRSLEIMVGIAGCIKRVWEAIAGAARANTPSAEVVYVRRHHDSTPMYLGFGALQSRLQPHARYLRPVEADRPGGYTRWLPCSFDEYRRYRPRVKPQFGILEVFAQEAEISTACTAEGPDTEIKTRLCMYPPMILQRPNASCVHEALAGVDYSSKSSSNIYFPVDRLKSMGSAENGEDPLIFLDDVPDGCKANKR